jgi:hypothetical protein
MTNPNITPLHLIKQEVVQAAACNEYVLTNINVQIIKAIIQHIPSLLQNAECALNVLWTLSKLVKKYPSRVALAAFV